MDLVGVDPEGLVGLVGIGLGVGLGGLVGLVDVGPEGLVGVGLGVGLAVDLGGLVGLVGVGSPLALQHAINPSWLTHLPPRLSQRVDP